MEEGNQIGKGALLPSVGSTEGARPSALGLPSPKKRSALNDKASNLYSCANQGKGVPPAPSPSAVGALPAPLAENLEGFSLK